MKNIPNVNNLRKRNFYTYIEFTNCEYEKIYTKQEYKLYRNEDVKYREEPIGTFITEILNNIDDIIATITICENNINKIKNDTIREQRLSKTKVKKGYIFGNTTNYFLKVDFERACITELFDLKEKLNKINPKLHILDCFIEQYIVHISENYDKLKNEYATKLADLKSAYPQKAKMPKEIKTVILSSGREIQTFETRRAMKNINLRNKLIPQYKKIIKKLRILEETTFMADKYLRITNTLKTYFEEIIPLINEAFLHDKESRNNKYSGMHSNLPAVEIEYETEYVKYPQPTKYTYRFESLRQLTAICIYQLSLNHRVIIKCKNCGKYIVPDRTDRQYCNENCKWRYMARKSLENYSKAYEYYRTLYNRYKNNKTYSKEFGKIKSIYNNYKTKQIDEDTFFDMLTNIEKFVKQNYNVKPGRPRKIQSKKLHEN